MVICCTLRLYAMPFFCYASPRDAATVLFRALLSCASCHAISDRHYATLLHVAAIAAIFALLMCDITPLDAFAVYALFICFATMPDVTMRRISSFLCAPALSCCSARVAVAYFRVAGGAAELFVGFAQASLPRRVLVMPAAARQSRHAVFEIRRYFRRLLVAGDAYAATPPRRH